MDALNIYLKQLNQLGAPVWSRSRNQGNQWLRGEIRIRNIQNPYQIVFEGVVGGVYGVSFNTILETNILKGVIKSF